MHIPKIKIPQKPLYVPFGEDMDFFKLFQKINKHFDTCFLLESLGKESHLARYSIIGFDPKHIISARKNTLKIDNKSYRVPNPYKALASTIPQNIIARNYAGGLIGYLGYDAAPYFEPALTLTVHKKFPQFLFGVYTDGLIFDNTTGEISYFYYTKNRIDELKALKNSKNTSAKTKPFAVKHKGDTVTKKQHCGMVAQVQKEILAGNTFQTQVGFKTEYQISGDPINAYTHLRKLNPSPHMFYLKFKTKNHTRLTLLGASPELLFRLRGKEMETYPLAGTTRRGRTAYQDQKRARALLRDKKEIAEHNMLVDLHRNDIGRVAEFGSVTVRRFMDVKQFSHVQHISSEIVGRLKNNEDMFTALASNFPAGTLSGAPKIESMKIIERIEKNSRGPYGGGVGHFSFNGDCTFTIPIRSLFIANDYAYTQNSGGIVYDSVADKEYTEIKQKGAAIKKVMESFT